VTFLFTRIASLLSFDDVEIALADAMFSRARSADSDRLAMFSHMFVFLTIVALSQRAVLDEFSAFFYLVVLYQLFEQQFISHFYDRHLHVKREIFLIFFDDLHRSCHLLNDQF
jgi:hypothetical protein